MAHVPTHPCAPNTPMTLRQIREACGLSRRRIAARVDRAEHTVKCFELDPSSVSRETREALEPVYRELARIAA